MSCLAHPLANCVSRPYLSTEETHWYAVYTNARHEMRVVEHLISKDIEVFVPTITVVRSWKDRKMKLQIPAFPGYVFTKICLSDRGRVISVPAVFRILSFNGVPARLDEAEIESIRLCQQGGALMESLPLFGVGERVRVKSGVLEGLVGFISRCKDERRLIVPLSHINQSLAVQVDVDLLEPAEKTSRYKFS
jgi:transcription antitermination factor NusG